MKKRINGIALATALATIGANAATVYVAPEGTGNGSSWENATGDLQAAIDAANEGDEIWVANGIYQPTRLIRSDKATSKAFILKNGVSLYGGFAGTESSLDERKKGGKPYEMINETVLSADDDVADEWVREIASGTTYRWTWVTDGNSQVPGTKNNSSHVVYCESTLTSPTTVDGFTLKGGNANVSQVKAAGGGVYGLGDLTLSNCRITDNSAYFTAEATDCNTYGGAVYLNGGKMDGCYVARAYSHSSYGNGYGGGVYGKNATISNCTFEECVGLDGGGAVYLNGGSLKDCTFTGCYSSAGGAVENNGGTVSNVEILDCRGLNGGGVYNNGTLEKALIRGCYADAEEYGENGGRGGAIYNVNGNAVNCAVFNNSSNQGGGVYMAGGKLINSTVLNNSARATDGGANIYGETAANTLNSITDATTDRGNFIAATSFEGRATTEAERALLLGADWALAPGSEMIDAGTVVEGFTSGTDLAGNPRVSGASIDRGAYEWQGEGRVPTMILTFAPGTESARLGVGGADGYEFSIDWGEGTEETYTEQAYYVHDLKGSTVKVYGDEVTVLLANSQNIIAADMSHAEALQQVQLIGNGLKTLTLGKHQSMTGLYASNNDLTTIDVSNCPALRVIDLHENAIEGAIDCSAMASLSKVDVADNRLTSLTLPKHTVLYEIDCSNNELTELDVTGLAGLSELSASGNKLTSIDLTGLDTVEEIYVDGNRLTTIDISPCQSLEKIMAAENAINTIDLSKNQGLTGVYLQENELTEIDITGNPSVRWFNVGKNHLTEINVASQKQLSILIADNNELTAVDLSNNTSLSSLDLSSNMIQAVDLSKIAYLSQCHLENNQLSELNVSGNPYLYGLFCGNNRLTTLDISANTYLQRLEAQGNALTELNVATNKGLQSLMLQSNKLEGEALNSLIAALPDVNSVNITPETADFLRQLNISHQPGTAEADVAAAEAKGWIVTAEYVGEEPVTIESLNIQINRTAAGKFVETYNSTIEYANEEQTMIRIVNFMGTGAAVNGSLDEDGNVRIAPQVCGTNEDYNFLMIVNEESTDGNPMMIYNTYVEGHFDGERLTLDPWNFIIVPYSFAENLGTYYTENLTSEFVKSNGKMTYTTVGGAELEQNVYAEVDDETLHVYGWGEYAHATLTHSGTKWNIDSETTACTTDGNDYVIISPEGEDVTSVSIPDARTVVFGAWQLASGSTMLRNATSATLTLDFDYSSGLSGAEVATSDAEVISTVYVDAAGRMSAEPVKGVNIRITTYKDGSTNVEKMVL